MLATDATKEMNPTTRISAPAAQHHSHLSFVDARRGWYAEDRGTILHTVDGGDHWMPQNSGTKSNLISIQFLPDGKRGWAVGDNGVILQTADGGIRWQSQRSGVKQILQGIQFLPDGRHGWAVIARGGMLHTTDGGVHWQLLCEQRNGQLCGAQFLADGARGWAISYQGMIWHTSDGGKTWQIQLILPKDTSRIHPGLGTTPIYSIAMLPDGEHGWAVGYKGTMLCTADGGAHWQSIAGGSNDWFMGVYFQADGQKGWIVGADGLLLCTIDGGSH
jgi:photosystem II stability/assembly factor-like uncharacterized protein